MFAGRSYPTIKVLVIKEADKPIAFFLGMNGWVGEED
jgi:hypothetical protein